VDTYLRALTEGDVTLVLSLFAPGGAVDSPLYGRLSAEEFYPMLFADTGSSELTLRAVMEGVSATGAPTIAFWFHFGWILPDGTSAPFSVVDVIEIDDEGRIANLHIVYDTVDVRPAFEAATGKTTRRSV
jgi:hypothetical protein